MIIIVQLLLFLAVVIGTVTLMRGAGNARYQAVRRILLAFFALAAALSVFFPTLLTRLANLLGIGRGTDLVLYALIVFFMLYMATSAQRTRQLEARITKLARRIALDETPKPAEVAESPLRPGVRGQRSTAAGRGAVPEDDGGIPPVHGGRPVDDGPARDRETRTEPAGG
ncbi:DUF2304 domain-containing protein [Arthrobacter mobilis]|uniref:DUF2304 domain-containing protein n=1 Tax=Arthrobacter mobilis TaxID=2724944 RepID=A0A7X6HB75_9MICC|nr:DUF2304 domain-containing protein [Arthrobacter mobilis]NKX53847.1 DUF2304 domain-containing protein [Arthrobacter mobilis]